MEVFCLHFSVCMHVHKPSKSRIILSNIVFTLLFYSLASCYAVPELYLYCSVWFPCRQSFSFLYITSLLSLFQLFSHCNVNHIVNCILIRKTLHPSLPRSLGSCWVKNCSAKHTHICACSLSLGHYSPFMFTIKSHGPIMYAYLHLSNFKTSILWPSTLLPLYWLWNTLKSF